MKRRELESELETELQFHLAMREQKLRAEGLSPNEAREVTRRRFGNMTSLREACREAWTFVSMQTLWQDVHYALRMLRRNAGRSMVAIVSLALGIGVNAAMFSLIDAILVRLLPYSQSERLVRVTGAYPKGAIAALQKRSKTMDVAGFLPDEEFNLVRPGATIHLVGSAVSDNLFSLLGVRAELGRTLQPGDEEAVVLSDALWKNAFQGEPEIIGREIVLDERKRRVVGIMPAGFRFPSFGAQVWIPLRLQTANWVATWGADFMPLIARLRPTASLADAKKEIRPLVSQIITLFPYLMARTWNEDADVIPLKQEMVGEIRGELLVLWGAVGIVLLLACSNVATLLISLAISRQKEMAVRAALGAARPRIVRQVLTESAVLALAGGTLGVGLAACILSLVKSALPATTPRLAEASVDVPVLAFTTGLVVLTGIICGLAPAFGSFSTDLAEATKAGGRRWRGAGAARLRNTLAAGQIGLAIVLFVCAALLIKSLWLLTAVNPGFRTGHIVTVRISPSQQVCEERAVCIVFYGQVLRDARGISGASDVAAANILPLRSDQPSIPVEIEGYPLTPSESLAPSVWAGAITADYLRIMGIPLLAGRNFNESDGQRSDGVVLVSAATASRFWLGENPIGKHIKPVWDDCWRTVVGVVGDVRQYDLATNYPDSIRGAIYLPYAQSVGLNRKLPAAMTLLVSTSAQPSRVAKEVQAIVSNLNPNAPVGEVQTVDRIVSVSTSSSRSLMWLFTSFAASALFLAGIGTYGVLSNSTAQRTYEIGMRLALGATQLDVLGLVLRQGLRLVLHGLAVGILASMVLARLLARFLFRVTATDPITYLLVTICVAMIVLVAGYVPARRAAAVDPVRALRVE